MRYEYYRRLSLRGRHWYWRLRANNNEIVAQGEGYRNKADMLDAIDLVKGSWDAVVVEKKAP